MVDRGFGCAGIIKHLVRADQQSQNNPRAKRLPNFEKSPLVDAQARGADSSTGCFSGHVTVVLKIKTGACGALGSSNEAAPAPLAARLSSMPPACPSHSHRSHSR